MAPHYEILQELLCNWNAESSNKQKNVKFWLLILNMSL